MIHNKQIECTCKELLQNFYRHTSYTIKFSSDPTALKYLLGL